MFVINVQETKKWFMLYENTHKHVSVYHYQT